VNVLGVPGSGFASPPIVDGRRPANAAEIVIDRRLGIATGDKVTLSGRRFVVVGHTRGISYYAGTAAVFLRLVDAQRDLLGGAPVATGIALQGIPRGVLPTGLRLFSNKQARASLARPLSVANTSIAYIDVMLWFAAAGIIGTILYMTALERIRDFAALKAIGARDTQVVSSLTVQSAIMSIASALAAFVTARVLEPIFPIPVEVPPVSYPLTLVVALGVGMLGSFAGVRRAVATDPALAFGG
jgi:putative ABC transport system permease protein